MDPLRVQFISAEAVPFVKVGGLADVAGSLPKALRALPDAPDVRLAMPLYGQINRKDLAMEQVADFTIPHEYGPMPARVFLTYVDDLPVYLIEGPPINPRDPIYSHDARENGAKFTFFSLAALELPRYLDWRPHILHAHDWHTAPAVYGVASNRGSEDGYYDQVATLLTVHNLPFLGVGAGPSMGAFGLEAALGSPLPDWAEHMPLPLGLLTADHINAVSPGYAAEMLTPEFSSNLHDFLASRKKTLSGILNGLDVERWDPATDAALRKNFDEDSLNARTENKLSLQRELSFGANTRIPLLSIISRMDHQKGIDIAIQGLRQMADQPWRAVILGTGDPHIEDEARQLGRDFPDKVRVFIDFDRDLARRIYAGADALLIPSRYEPCGLTQMIAMRYGNVPIGRATGGLKDTIIDHDADEAEGNGFLFDPVAPAAFVDAIKRALAVFHDQRRWRAIQRHGMKRDYSWGKSAREYYNLYKSLVERKK